jgi:hypothetical protein
MFQETYKIFAAGVVKPNQGITKTEHMLMNDAQRHLRAQAHNVVVSLGPGKQQSTGEASAGGGRNSMDPDYKNLKYLTTIYTRQSNGKTVCACTRILKHGFPLKDKRKASWSCRFLKRNKECREYFFTGDEE